MSTRQSPVRQHPESGTLSPLPERRGLAWAAVALIRAYQRWISPMLGPSCRFTPSCSRYAAEALNLHGPVRGTWLAVRRLARCHPFHPGGHDPVPQRRTRSS